MAGIEAGLRAPVSTSFWEQKAKRLEADNARLSEKIDDMEMEIDDLKRELGVSRDDALTDALKQQFGLTPLEARLLACLYQAGGATVAKERAMMSLYGNAIDVPEIKIVDVLICKLRGKMDAEAILTSWGKGYALSSRGVNLCRGALGLPVAEIEDAPIHGRVSKARRPGRTARMLSVLKTDEWMTAAMVAIKVPGAATTDVSTLLGSESRRHGRVEVRRNMVGAKSVLNHYRLTPAGKDWLKDQRERGVL
jgi:hypothetical protein